MKKSNCIFILSIIFFLSCQVKEIKENKGITIGKIIGKLDCAKGGYDLTYKYTVGNKNYKNFASTTIYKCRFDNTFKGKYFPVLYSEKNPQKSFMLLIPQDYKNWGYPFPDSLNWVKDCIGGL
jgi:hypothetical protein